MAAWAMSQNSDRNASYTQSWILGLNADLGARLLSYVRVGRKDYEGGTSHYAGDASTPSCSPQSVTTKIINEDKYPLSDNLPALHISLPDKRGKHERKKTPNLETRVPGQIIRSPLVDLHAITDPQRPPSE